MPPTSVTTPFVIVTRTLRERPQVSASSVERTAAAEAIVYQRRKDDSIAWRPFRDQLRADLRLDARGVHLHDDARIDPQPRILLRGPSVQQKALTLRHIQDAGISST